MGCHRLRGGYLHHPPHGDHRQRGGQTPAHPGGPGQDQVQPADPAAGGGLHPAAASTEGAAEVQRETLRQLLQPEIQGLPVRGRDGQSHPAQHRDRQLRPAAEGARPAENSLPRSAAPVCQAHDKKYSLKRRNSKSSNQ